MKSRHQIRIKGNRRQNNGATWHLAHRLPPPPSQMKCVFWQHIVFIMYLAVDVVVVGGEFCWVGWCVCAPPVNEAPINEKRQLGCGARPAGRSTDMDSGSLRVVSRGWGWWLERACRRPTRARSSKRVRAALARLLSSTFTLSACWLMAAFSVVRHTSLCSLFLSDFLALFNLVAN
jgi:hypothetical protein